MFVLHQLPHPPLYSPRSGHCDLHTLQFDSQCLPPTTEMESLKNHLSIIGFFSFFFSLNINNFWIKIALQTLLINSPDIKTGKLSYNDFLKDWVILSYSLLKEHAVFEMIPNKLVHILQCPLRCFLNKVKSYHTY